MKREKRNGGIGEAMSCNVRQKGSPWKCKDNLFILYKDGFLCLRNYSMKINKIIPKENVSVEGYYTKLWPKCHNFITFLTRPTIAN